MKKEFLVQSQLLNTEVIFFFLFAPASFVTIFKTDIHSGWVVAEAIVAFLMAKYLIAPKFYVPIVVVNNKIFKIGNEQYKKADIKQVHNRGKVISIAFEQKKYGYICKNKNEAEEIVNELSISKK